MPGPLKNQKNSNLTPWSEQKRGRQKKGLGGSFPVWIFILGVLALGIISFPSFFSFEISREVANLPATPFPVSVDPANKVILDNPQADALFKTENTPLAAAVVNAKYGLGLLASAITALPGYGIFGEPDTRFVTVYPGYREEQVANAFGKELNWNSTEQNQFLTLSHSTAPILTEGEFAPDTYTVNGWSGPVDVQKLLSDRFQKTVLDRYSTSTAAKVPLQEGLTVASLLERETNDPNEMRLISGIIWNRLFIGMNLQIDATLQYAKSAAKTGAASGWWPKIVPKDKYIQSAYNTYASPGLPPAPIANPSVAAVIAALNPKKTDCLYYFHDKQGNFHCSATYQAHVAMLKKYYGQGK